MTVVLRISMKCSVLVSHLGRTPSIPNTIRAVFSHLASYTSRIDTGKQNDTCISCAITLPPAWLSSRCRAVGFAVCSELETCRFSTVDITFRDKTAPPLRQLISPAKIQVLTLTSCQLIPAKCRQCQPAMQMYQFLIYRPKMSTFRITDRPNLSVQMM